MQCITEKAVWRGASRRLRNLTENLWKMLWGSNCCLCLLRPHNFCARNWPPGRCLCGQSLVCSLSLEQREGAQNKSVAQGPMTPARVLVNLLPIQALCSRSLPSVFREGGFGSYKSSSQQVLLLAAKWKNIGVKLLNQREKKSIL